ncbi:dTDP-4-dehydrorhamnose reductase [Candidatus Parcubacteria bacterium]|nr:dTDP-4-dehydrorhamnose reductase [Candidatus Parcubacteria bacterium]
MKKILIIGGKGNLGVQLQKVFANEYNVISFDKEELDITNRDLVLKNIKNINPDILINSAAYNAVDNCESSDSELEKAKKINGYALGYLAEATLKSNAILIHFSSDYVFSGNKSKPEFTENDIPNPINKYGKTKLLGENKILKFKNKELKYYIIRVSKLFGPKGESDVAKPSFFDVMLSLSKTNNQLDIVDEEISCFTYTLDLAEFTKKLVESTKNYGIYHFVNEGSCTWYKATKELFKIAKIDIKINPVSSDKFPRPAKRPKYSILKNTKFEKLRNYKDALREYLSINSKI